MVSSRTLAILLHAASGLWGHPEVQQTHPGRSSLLVMLWTAPVSAVCSLSDFGLARWFSLSLGAWVPKNLARRSKASAALLARPARAAWAVQRLLAARW